VYIIFSNDMKGFVTNLQLNIGKYFERLGFKLMSVALVVHRQYHVIVQKVGGSNLLSYVCVCTHVCIYVCVYIYIYMCVCHTLLDPVLTF